MNTRRILLAVAAFATLLSTSSRGWGQNTSLPVVTVHASDAVAAEPDNPGVFRLLREGPTNVALRVWCALEGTASNGVDYKAITNWLVIPAGVRAIEVPVVPIDDALVEERETVSLRLVTSPVMPPISYLVGVPSNAVVVIADNDTAPPPPTNRPPEVRIVAPTNGAYFPSGADILVAAHALDADGYPATVEFFLNDRSLGITTNNPLVVPPTNPFLLVWSNAPAGEYTLTALVTDDGGATALSAAVRVVVYAAQPVVTVRATDARASEPGVLTVIDPGIFTLTRNRGTNIDLPVRFTMRGTAVNGVDYAALTGLAIIPKGAWETTVTVNPLGDNLVEGVETAILHVEPAVCPAVWPPPPECYLVGTNAEAVVEIVDRSITPPETNAPPKVRFMAPLEGMTFRAGTKIGLLAETVDADGYTGKVEFYADTNKLGERVRTFIIPPAPGSHIPYEFIWSNAPAGRYSLTAVATDDDGAASRSEPVRIAVLEVTPPPPPPATNPPAIVSIVALDAVAAEGTNCWHPECRSNCWAHGSCLTNCTGCHPTNCRPNVAVFAVRRAGSTNGALDVRYAIGGTASNGVDYVELPGRVTIPEGERGATIVVLPIDDAQVERLESVVLGILPPTTDPATTPSYVVGAPARAEAVIADNDRSRPGTGALSDRTFHLQLPGTNGMTYGVQVSDDMIHWTTLLTNVVTEGAIHFADPDAGDAGKRFYRAIRLSNP